MPSYGNFCWLLCDAFHRHGERAQVPIGCFTGDLITPPGARFELDGLGHRHLRSDDQLHVVTKAGCRPKIGKALVPGFDRAKLEAAMQPIAEWLEKLGLVLLRH